MNDECHRRERRVQAAARRDDFGGAAFESHFRRRAVERSVESLSGVVVEFGAVVGEQEGAQRLAEVDRARDVRVRWRLPVAELVPGEPALQTGRHIELVRALLDVQRVHESTDDLQVAGGAARLAVTLYGHESIVTT